MQELYLGTLRSNCTVSIQQQLRGMLLYSLLTQWSDDRMHMFLVCFFLTTKFLVSTGLHVCKAFQMKISKMILRLFIKKKNAQNHKFSI